MQSGKQKIGHLLHARMYKDDYTRKTSCLLQDLGSIAAREQQAVAAMLSNSCRDIPCLDDILQCPSALNADYLPHHLSFNDAGAVVAYCLANQAKLNEYKGHRHNR